jgi:hypothetical protein
MGTVTIDATAISKMIEDALAFSSQLSGLEDGEQALQAIGGGDCCVCSYLRYGLCKELGQYLGGIDASVRAVYAYEPEHCTGVAGALDDREGERFRGINLLVSVDRRSAALTSILASLEDAVCEATGFLVCPEGSGPCYMLDVKVADEGELSTRRGYGALVSSIHVRPLRIWARDE